MLRRSGRRSPTAPDFEHHLHPSALYRDFLTAPDRLRDFYPVDFRDTAAAAAVVGDYPAARRERMSGILARQAESFCISSASREPLEKFRRPNCLVVVAGQQPGLFGGPLYTLYKALTAIALAKRIETAAGRPVVPIFWIASDDHDFDEVRKIHVSDGGGEPVLLEVPADAAPHGASFSKIRIGPEMGPILERLASLVPVSEFRDGSLEPLRDAYAPGRGWSEAFARYMGAFVAPLGALVFDAADAEAKALALPVFEREVALGGSSASAARATGERLTSLGYHAQIAREGNELNLFWHEEAREAIRIQPDGRLRLSATGGTGGTGGSGRTLGRDEFLALLRAHPEQASPGVLLRPLTQDYLFPTAAYVGGPAEVAYWAQVIALYPLFGIRPPAVAPRAGATILEPKIRKTLDRFGLAWPALCGDVEAVIGESLRALLPEDFPETFARERDQWDRSFERLEAKVVAFDPSLRAAVETAAGKVEHEGHVLEKKLMQVWKRRQEESVQQIRRAATHLFPHGKLQERVYAPIGYAARYGPELIQRLERLLEEPGSHVLVPLGGPPA